MRNLQRKNKSEQKSQKHNETRVDTCYNQKKEMLIGVEDMANYKAIDIARYVVDRCCEHGNPISNLQLQKILYFLWIDYYADTSENLFNDHIFAWSLGPVVPEVYNEFKHYGASRIWEEYNIELTARDKRIIDRSVDRNAKYSAYDLVNRSHRKGGAWDIIFNNGRGDRYLIPYSLIKEKME